MAVESRRMQSADILPDLASELNYHGISGIEKIRAVAIDFDGTLYNRKNGITTLDMKTFAQLSSQGFIPFLATGRSMASVKAQLNDEILQRMNYSSLCPGVYSNGAVVYDKEGNIIHRATIKRPLYLETLRIVAELDLLPYTIIYTEAGGYCASPDIFDKDLFTSIEAEPLLEPGSEGLHSLDCIKFVFLLSPDHLVKVRPVLAEKLPSSLYCLRSDSFLLEILPYGVNKASGIQKLLDLYSLTTENLIAFGDEENDLAMLKLAAIPVAMGDAVADIKAQAKLVVGTSLQSGFSEAMQKLFGIT